MIQAVLFDGDQTLWDFERVMRDALVAVAGRLRATRPGPFTDALSWEDLQADRADVARERPDVWSLAELRVHGFARTLERRRDAEGGDPAADEPLARQLSDLYFTERDREAALFPDTVPGLDALRSRYRLGLLSNGSRLPETVGLAAYFETVVFAQDHRVAKPDKGIFEVVERQLDVGPDACVLVGDHPVNDVAGARGAGWRSVWIDRDGAGAFPADGPQPDAVVHALTELPDVLRRLGDTPPASDPRAS
jgi:FMN hydrolase / 5-amino-6-(5-phospho-D-ribitylamino)uracil phosphatase